MTKLYTAVLLLLLASACKTPQKMYNQGNYDEALERAVKKLQKDPGDAAAAATAKDAYQYLVARYDGEIRSVLAGTDENRFAQAYRRYGSLQQLYRTVLQSPAAVKAVRPTDYSGYLDTYRNKAAEPYISRARTWMAEDNKRAYREAYRLLRTAQEFKPNDYELDQLTETAYRGALTIVLVKPMDAYGSNYHYSNSSFQLRNFQDRLIRQLNNSTGSDFIRYVTDWDAQARDLRPDEFVDMRLGRMRFGQPFDRTETRQVERQVVVKETVHKKDSVVKEYATVRATITTVRRILVSEAGLLMTNHDREGRILWQDEFTGEHRWETKFVTWTGDERALSDADRQLVKNNAPGNQPLPREDEIVDELLRQIQNDLASRLRGLYRRGF